jgi:hypothetical protein
MALCSDTVSTPNNSTSVESIKPQYKTEPIQRNNSLFRRFSTSSLSQTEFSQKEEIRGLRFIGKLRSPRQGSPPQFGEIRIRCSS